MTNTEITILTCHDKGAKATKVFTMQANGIPDKKSFSAGRLFSHEIMQVSNLAELAEIIEGISQDSKSFIIKGKLKENMPEIVRRKLHEPAAAFDAVPRPYVMLDIDKQACPPHLDPALNPEGAVTWVKNMLPSSFRESTCYYRFSSSQNIHKDKEGNKTISLHLWYWCDRDVLDEEWKRYFHSESSVVDYALFSPVQIHYTATPIFEGMSDPLPKRSGILKGKYDVVKIPNIPERKTMGLVTRYPVEPSVSVDDQKLAMGLFQPYYKEGGRDRLSGAIAATLYRGGWNAENAAEFVYELAQVCLDDEADTRYSNAIKICEAVDQNLPAQGKPTLKKEFGISDLDKILNLLGVGEQNIDVPISKLTHKSEIDEICKVMELLLFLPDLQHDFYLDEISKRTSKKKGEINSLFKKFQSEKEKSVPLDVADQLMELLLTVEYGRGEYLLYSADKTYWAYNGKFWDRIPEQEVKSVLLPIARKFLMSMEGGSIANFNNAVMNILEGRVYRQHDPLRSTNADANPVINCLNGELWFDSKGDFELRPHRSDSYLRYCLDVEFDPEAKSPMFDQAVLDIFSKSDDSEGLFRHFMELAGYICQPWRKLAVIVLLHGNGGNGKTCLMEIIRRMMGNNTVMSDRISDIEGCPFKIGDLEGKLMLMDDDVDGGTCLPDGFLKKISEQKPMTGQHKFKPPFEFICRAVPVMLANDYPVTKDLSYGIRRRLLVIPFRRTFEAHEMKIGLFDDIWRNEASGILNHIVAGFKRLKQRQHFKEPEDCINARTEWIRRSNILTTFIDEMCELEEKQSVFLANFYDTFTQYCSSVGVKNIAARKGIENRLESLGYRIGILDGAKAIWGLKLKEENVKIKPNI